MKTIASNNGEQVLVDDDDYPLLARRVWSVSAAGYPCSKITGANMTPAHCFVMPTKPGCMIDHIDRNKMNNQKSNLRQVIARQNIQNQAKRTSHPYKGIRLSAGGRWQARIAQKHIGTFDTAEQAAEAYDLHAKEIFGNSAFTNLGGK